MIAAFATASVVIVPAGVVGDEGVFYRCVAPDAAVDRMRMSQRR